MDQDMSDMPQARSARAGWRARRRRNAAPARVPLVLTATAALVVIAAATVLTGGAHAQEGGPLSPARFAAIDSVYLMSIGVEGGTIAIADARRACQALDRGDRLLASLATTCRSSLKLASASETLGACETRSACGRATKRMRVSLSAFIGELRAANAIVALNVPEGACRTELSASRSLLRQLTKLRDGFKLLERGRRTRNSALIDRAGARIIGAAAQLAEQPTSLEARETFLRVCAPPAPVAPQAPAS